MSIIIDQERPPSKFTTIVAPIGKEHTHTVIFLHGREDYGEYMAKDFFDSKSSGDRTLAEIFPTIRWVFPTAKIRYSAKRDDEFSNSSFASALKGEEFVSQWFDVWDVRDPEIRKELLAPGLLESIEQILVIIREEAESVPMERIILGGLSQGCAAAIYTLLFSGLDLGGFIGWCGWLPFQRAIEDLAGGCIGHKHEISRQIQNILRNPPTQDSTPSEPTKPVSNARESLPCVGTAGSSKDVKLNNLEPTRSNFFPDTQSAIKTPVFLAHSEDDLMVPFKLGNDLHQFLKSLGFGVTWKQYDDGGHWIDEGHGVDDMSTFLRRVMNT